MYWSSAVERYLMPLVKVLMAVPVLCWILFAVLWFAVREVRIAFILVVLIVGLVLSFVTMLSVLSVPLMVAGSQPTMLTVDMAFRINSYGDYATANALGVISYAMTAIAAWIYLRHQIRREAAA